MGQCTQIPLFAMLFYLYLQIEDWDEKVEGGSFPGKI